MFKFLRDGTDYSGAFDESEVDAATAAVAKAVAGGKLSADEKFAAQVFVTVAQQLLDASPKNGIPNGGLRNQIAQAAMAHLRKNAV
jgi:hypothetical protein